MTDTEQLFQDKLSPHFKVMDITNVNDKPHPYTIGAGHVAHAADHFGGSLGEAAIESYEKAGGHCAAYGNCRVPYVEHTSDRVLFLQLTDNLEQAKGEELLKGITDLLKVNKVDGIAFVESKEKYRFI